MKTIEEIESILSTYSGGPIVITAAKDLLELYKLHQEILAQCEEINAEQKEPK